ncbi:hypothetical protein GW17_00056996 [Ensete ventricosum]|nr:hypothetical protein GW17_00056996 [Ensete ventricosum]
MCKPLGPLWVDHRQFRKLLGRHGFLGLHHLPEHSLVPRAGRIDRVAVPMLRPGGGIALPQPSGAPSSIVVAAPYTLLPLPQPQGRSTSPTATVATPICHLQTTQSCPFYRSCLLCCLAYHSAAFNSSNRILNPPSSYAQHCHLQPFAVAVDHRSCI